MALDARELAQKLAANSASSSSANEQRSTKSAPPQDDPALVGFTIIQSNMSAVDRCCDAACSTLGFDIAEVRTRR